MDNLSRDVAEAMRLGYGPHYGRYKADHPGERPVTKEMQQEVIPEEPEEKEQVAVCQVCGVTFYRGNYNKKYCGERCRAAANRKLSYERYKKRHPLEEIICRNCGKSFRPETRHQKHCSPDCRIRYETKTRKKKREDEKRAQSLSE